MLFLHPRAQVRDVLRDGARCGEQHDGENRGQDRDDEHRGVEPLRAERLQRAHVEAFRLADEAAELRGDEGTEAERLHRAGDRRSLEREIVADQPGADRSERGAEQIHRAEVQRHRRAAQRRLDDVVDRRIDNRVIRVHHAAAGAHQQREAPHVAARTREAEIHQRRAQHDRPAADDQTAIDAMAIKAIGERAAGDEPDRPREAVDGRGHPAGVEKIDFVEADEERRHERSERVHVEVVQRPRRDDPPHRRNRQHEQERIALAAAIADLVFFLRATPRLANQERRGGAEESRHRGHVKGIAPSPVLQNPAAGAVGQTEAERQTEHPDRGGARARGRREEIADERRRGGRAGRFADADAEARGDELTEIARKARRCRERAPDEHARRQDDPTRLAVRQPAERKAEHGIQQREDRAEQSEGGVAEPPFAPDALTDAADDLAVEEVHEVDGEENHQRVEGGWSHRFLVSRGAPPLFIAAGPHPRRCCSAHARLATAQGCHALTRSGRGPRAYLKQNVADSKSGG